MKNELKMLIYKDESNKLREKFIRPLPNQINSYNSLILTKGKGKAKTHEMIQITPTHCDIGKPMSFDILFLTGEYQGLFLDNVKPYLYDHPFKKNKSTTSEENEAIIFPAKIIAEPTSYNNYSFYFKLGEYKSTNLDPNVIMNIFKEIRQWDTISLDYAIEIINHMNKPEELEWTSNIENI